MTKALFINLSNHPTSKWSTEQLNAVYGLFGENPRILDMGFPIINPNYHTETVGALAEEFVEKITELSNPQNIIVHVMGEMSFVFTIVSRLKNLGVRCCVSTTNRVVEEVVKPDGSTEKVAIFKFVRFRDY
jgi:hypothetical protein